MSELKQKVEAFEKAFSDLARELVDAIDQASQSGEIDHRSARRLRNDVQERALDYVYRARVWQREIEFAEAGR